MSRKKDRHLCPRRDELGGGGVFRLPEYDTWITQGGHRRCSYCGSLHPDEFMQVARDGSAEIGPTDKNYKAYVEGVGSHTKFYFQHLTIEQRREFVDLYNERPVRRYGEAFDFEVIDDRGGKLTIGYPGYFYQLPFFMGR